MQQEASLGKSETLVRVTSDYFCAGMAVEGDKVIYTAPILEMMKGRTVAFAKDYISRMGWKATIVREGVKDSKRG